MAEQDRDQRTEQATPQRIRRAFEEGQVGISSELLGSVAFATGVVFFLLAGAWFFSQIVNSFRDREIMFQHAIVYPESLRRIIQHDMIRMGKAVLAMIVPVFLITALVGGLQTNFNISFKPLELKWDKINISKGFEKIFSMRSAVKGIMAVVKVTAILLIAILFASSQFETILYSGTFSIEDMVFKLGLILLYLSLAAAATITLIGVADMAFQKWKHMQDLRMSIRDIRDEQKDSEGDPQIKARLKRLQNEMGRQRMMQDVATSTVVVTNPTHFAVALKYENKSMLAPKVVAKGADHLAKRIIEVAKENGVPVVERKPVARFLYFNVQIDQMIPPELYTAVAEVLNFVNRF